jgi:hypothetical protein
MKSKIFRIAGSVVVCLHGLVHLMGPGVYWQLTEIEGLVYKTTLLSGSLNVGEAGIRIFGGLWLLGALGFAVAAAGMATGEKWARQVLLGTGVLSLALTCLDWPAAFAVVLVNLGILGVQWFSRRAGNRQTARRLSLV